VDVPKEIGEDSFEKVPIFGSNGEQGAEPEIGAFEFVNIESG